jgi:hypothetical protein
LRVLGSGFRVLELRVKGLALRVQGARIARYRMLARRRRV